MKQYAVWINGSEHNSTHRVDALSPQEAADIYVSAVINETISVETQELIYENKVMVYEHPAISETSRIVEWLPDAEFIIGLREINSFNRALESGELDDFDFSDDGEAFRPR